MPNQKNSTDQKGTSAIGDAAVEEAVVVLEKLRTSSAGLSEAEAATRLEQYGPNEVAQEKQHGWLRRLWIAAWVGSAWRGTVVWRRSFVSLLIEIRFSARNLQIETGGRPVIEGLG